MKPAPIIVIAVLVAALAASWTYHNEVVARLQDDIQNTEHARLIDALRADSAIRMTAERWKHHERLSDSLFRAAGEAKEQSAVHYVSYAEERKYIPATSSQALKDIILWR